MKRSIFLLAILLMSLVSCHKEEDLRADFVGDIDPNKDPNKLSEVLGIEGTHKSGSFPLKQTSGLQITNYQTSVSASQNTDIYIPFTYDANNAPKGIYLHVIGAENRYWDIPMTIINNDNSYVFKMTIPPQVLSGNFTIEYIFYDSDLNTSEKATTHIKLSKPTSICRGGCVGGSPYSESGESGPTNTTLVLGDQPGIVFINYEMYTLPDRMDIKYDGAWVGSTASQLLLPGQNIPSSICFDGQQGYISGSGTLSFVYNPSQCKEVTIYMYGCYGETAWEFSVTCPTGTNPPDIKPYNFNLSANSSSLNTGIEVGSGDYVFFGITGKSSLGIPDGNGGNIRFEYADARGLEDKAGYDNYKKYPQFKLGQVLLSLGSMQYSANTYSVKNQNCSIFAQQLSLNNLFFEGEYGDYFVSNQRGTLMLDMNLKGLNYSSANLKVEIYVLSFDQHIDRNCFNKCPLKEPKSGVDSKNWAWDDGALTSQSIAWFDDSLEECYHGGMEDYRGEGVLTENKGCQCVYDSNGDLYNTGKSMGTFDYGYIGTNSGIRKHFILDVFSNIVYNNYSVMSYSPTSYTYP